MCVSTNVPPPPRFFLLLQKLEEFLFDMEENHAEVGPCERVAEWRRASSQLRARARMNQPVNLNSNVTSAASPHHR